MTAPASSARRLRLLSALMVGSSACASAGLESIPRDGTSMPADLILGTAVEQLVTDENFPWVNWDAFPDSVSYCVSRVVLEGGRRELSASVRADFAEGRVLLPGSACASVYLTEPGDQLWAAVQDSLDPAVFHIYLSGPDFESADVAWVPVRTYFREGGFIHLCRVARDGEALGASCSWTDGTSRVWR